MVHLIDMLGTLSDAAFAVDRNARIVAWSPGAKELLGLSKERVIGERCGDVLQGVYTDGGPLCARYCDGHNCFRNGKNLAVESAAFRHSDGRMITVQISSISVSPEQRASHPDGAVAIIFLQKTQSQSQGVEFAEPLQIFTLGRFSLAVHGKGLDIDAWKRKQALSVLKYLTANVGRSVHRERLIEYMWPGADPTTGWKRLKVAVSYLRGQLCKGGLSFDAILTVEESYVLRDEAVWIDAREFEKQIAAGHALERQRRLKEALVCFEYAKRLYGGDYLENDLHSEWSANKREQLRELYFEMLAGMAKCLAELGDYVGSAKACREALYRDQSRESFLRSLIEAQDNIDRADWQKPQLDIWQRVLTEEFNIVPKPEQLRLFREIVETRARPNGHGDGSQTVRK